jgi:tetratricopeptide (TPR) repeat protein
LESEEEKAFYNPPAPLTEELPADVRRFAELLRERSAILRPVAGWSVAASDLREAAEIFAAAAHEVFGVRLSVDDEDPTHFDAFLNRYLIAEELRPLFDGAQVREDFSDADYERFAQLIGKTPIPAEESVYYFAGAYWGEWLVRHRGATWALHAPLRPLQAFPDMITAHQTVALLPFSQVVKKLADPVSDTLASKAHAFGSEYLPPYPLIASLADSEEATVALMPEKARAGLEAAAKGDMAGALALLQEAAEGEPENLLVLAHIQVIGWQAEEWEAVHRAMTQLLRQHPHARTFYNLGVFYAQFDLLEEAVESIRQAVLLHPPYDRAKLTMAALLAEKGEMARARSILQEVAGESFDPQMQEEVARLLAELGE